MFSLALSYEVVELRREELSGHDGLLEADGSRFMSLQMQDSFQWEINECHGVIGKWNRLGDHRSSEHGSAGIRRENPWALRMPNMLRIQHSRTIDGRLHAAALKPD